MINLQERKEEILDLYAKGYSSSFIAEMFEVNKQRIIYILRKEGVIRSHKIKNMTINGYSLKIYDKEIISLYKEGYSCQYIGQKLGLSRASVYSRLKINNIELRPVKGNTHSIRNPTITLNYFKDKVNSHKDDFDYFLGVLATDGNVFNNVVRISGIADENIEFLEHWCSFLDNKVKISRKLRTTKKSYYNCVAFKNINIVNYLKEYGIVPNKTFILELPYINWNVVRGAFDGDGCLVKDKRCNSWKFEIVSASIKFANQLYDFYTKEGLKAHIYKEGNLYKINILQRESLKKVYTNMYKNCSYFLKRKYDKFLPIIQETE